MRAWRRYGPVLAIPAVVVIIAFVATSVPWRTSSSVVGRPAPEVRLEVEAGPGAGSLFELESGQVTVLEFWASWCPPCRESTPILNRLAEELPAARFVGVNVETLDTAQLRRAHGSFGSRLPTIVDRSGTVAEAFGVASLPTLIVVDSDRKVAHVERGVPDEADLRARIALLLGDSVTAD